MIRHTPSHRLRLLCLTLLLTALTAAGGRPAAAQETQTADTAQQYVSIDFNDVDITVFIKFISELTGSNFLIDQRVKGKVTVISPSKISVAEAYKVFESVLEVHGFAAVPAGKVTKIVPAPDARTKSIETRLREEWGPTEDKVVTQLVPLRYADPDEIKQLFTPLVSKSSVILSYRPTNMLIVTDVYSNIKRLLRILEVIDVTGIGQEISVIPLEYADAKKMVQIMGTVFKEAAAAKKGEPEPGMRFVADERTNTIVMLASEVDTLRAKQLIRMLDKDVPRGNEKIRVIYLEHATAEELAEVLQSLTGKSAKADKEGGKAQAPVVSADAQITADKATNSLIILAEKEDFLVLEDIIAKLDIPRSQVYIEALIMEVNVDKDFRLGTEWVAGGEVALEDREGYYAGGFSGGAGGGDPGYLNIPGAAGLLPPGFSLGIFQGSLSVDTAIGTVTFPNIGALIQAYHKDKDVHILSTPQILTTDNEEAKITVGKNVPFQTKTSTTDNDTFNSFEYRDVGKTLTITPQISKDRQVRLKIALEVTDLESTTDFRPTTLKRTIDTTVLVRDGNTIVIGGLIDDQVTNTTYKVPCLGSAPGLGWLFKSNAKTGIKTNLYVFLTPRVIQSPEEAKTVYGSKRDQIEAIEQDSLKLYPKPDAPAAAPE